MIHFRGNADGFTAVDLVLTILVIIVIGFAAYSALTKSKPSSFIPGQVLTTNSRTFPGNHLSFQLPKGWQFAIIPDNFSGGGGLVTTRQTSDYGYAEYASTVSGPTTLTINEPHDCGLCGGTEKLQDFVVTIADFGTASYTTADKWYQSTLDKTFDDPLASPSLVQSGANYRQEESSGTEHYWSKIGGQPGYCVSVPSGEKTSIQYPQNIPSALSSGGCYVIWSNRVYFVEVTDNAANSSDLPQSVSVDRANVIKLLSSFQFK